MTLLQRPAYQEVKLSTAAQVHAENLPVISHALAAIADSIR